MTEQPQDPYGQPPQMPPPGQMPPPTQPGYGAGGQVPGGRPPAGGADLAEWPLRAASFLIDYVAAVIPAIVGLILGGIIGGGFGGLLMFLGYVATIGVWVWNIGIKQAENGQSIGKGYVGLRVIGEEDGQVPSVGTLIARGLLHIVDSIPCYIGYLWPLWDEKKQTFSDKIVKTVVLQNQPKSSPF